MLTATELAIELQKRKALRDYDPKDPFDLLTTWEMFSEKDKVPYLKLAQDVIDIAEEGELSLPHRNMQPCRFCKDIVDAGDSEVGNICDSCSAKETFR